MNAEETQACARVLLAVATADGKLDPEERRLIELFGGDSHTKPVDVEGELAKIRSTDGKARTLHAAIAVADIDGHCTKNERALLELIFARLGGVGPVSLREMHAETRARVDEVRERLEEATIAFLHAVGSKGHDLDQKSYESLAAELDAKKRALLRGAVDEGD